MKLDKQTIDEIVEKCATKLIHGLGEEVISEMPYDAMSIEISEMVEEIEDGIDNLITSKIESHTKIYDVEEIWDDVN